MKWCSVWRFVSEKVSFDGSKKWCGGGLCYRRTFLLGSICFFFFTGTLLESEALRFFVVFLADFFCFVLVFFLVVDFFCFVLVFFLA